MQSELTRLRDLLATDRLFLVIAKFFERPPEFGKQRHPVFLPQRYGVEIVLEVGREIVVNVASEMFGEKTIDDAGDVGRIEPLALDLDVLAILQRRNDARVSRWSPDAVLFQRLYEAGFGETWRRVRKVLLGTQLIELDNIAFDDLG